LKGKTTSSISSSADPSFLTGLSILAVAQLLSAIMGLYTQLTYAAYGAHWHENLFYSHFISIPFFIPFLPSLSSEFHRLLLSSPVLISPALLSPSPSIASNFDRQNDLPSSLFGMPSWPSVAVPRQIINLGLNALTQYACIRGVNLLSARTTALGVTIVLNLRKLVSLFASIWIFGNRLRPGVVLGAIIVFSSAGVWAAEGQRLHRKGERPGTIKA
jgi:UDP-xylose/UDP-N-acetylglucosamine transporter B4